MQNNTFSGLFVGQNLIVLTEVDSTNNFLKQALTNSTPLIEGTVIMAESQTAGRGQQNNKWLSEPKKNLTFSILLNPFFLTAPKQFNLNIAISIGINNALNNILSPGLKIKWPNDIYYNNQKLGGILIENVLQGDAIKHSVIGIGINVNQVDFANGLGNATSVKKITGLDYDLKSLLGLVCQHIEAAYLMLKAGNFEKLKAAYVGNLYQYNKTAYFKVNDTVCQGQIFDVDATGQLLVNIDGTARSFNFKEIEFLNYI